MLLEVCSALSGDKLCDLELDQHGSLTTLYNLVARSTGVSPLKQSLFNGDDLLGYDGPIVGSGLQDGCKLKLVRNPCIVVLTASEDGSAKLWKDGACILTFDHDMRDDAIDDEDEDLFDPAHVAPEILKPAIIQAFFVGNGCYVLTTTRAGGVKLWSVCTGKCVQRFECDNSATFSSDMSMAVTTFTAGELKIYQASPWACRHILQHASRVNCATFSADCSVVLSASDDTTAKLWRASSGELVCTFQGHVGIVYSAQFTASGSQVLTASHDGTAKLWNASTGECIRTFVVHADRNPVVSAKSSRDGSMILSLHCHCVRLWDLQTGRCLHTLQGAFASAAFSQDSSMLVTAAQNDSTATVWSAHTGQCMQTLLGHGFPLCNAEFSFDGELVLTSSDDHDARIWNHRQGTCIDILRHADNVHSATFLSEC